MKPPFTAHYPSSFQGRYRSGVALLLVLSVVAILMLFITGFLVMVQTETRSAGSYAKGEETRILSDLPLNLVIAQVRKATENNGSTKTWASQPGMIRVFGQNVDSTTQRTKLERAYKLYSAEQMEVAADGSGLTPQVNPATEIPTDWDSKVALFTDLNAPVYTSHDSSGKATNPVYPIADPAAFTDQTDAVGSTKRLDGVELVDTTGLEKLPKGSAANANPLPMPVRWLYILQDGTITAGTDAGDPKKVRVDGASTANPITGRIAFWADDECSKVNINTASEGVFWDTPLGDTNIERGGGNGIGADPTSYVSGSVNLWGYASGLPVRNEFTRYPGHPSRTCLSSVLGPWLPLSSTPTPTELDQYYKITPRVSLGGTKAGTVISTYTGGFNGTSGNVGLNPVDKDRLYASTDELVFAPNRSMEAPALTASVLARTRFFLTAHSRAPEVNLFNKPRMALWPFSTDTNYRNAVDKLIAFASTCSQQPFYFQRSRCSNDATQNSSSDPSEDYSSVTRNRQLYTYLQQLSQTNIPGFGGNFKSKYGDDSDQILTEMFDYMRGEVNYSSQALTPKYQYLSGGSSSSGPGGECWIAPLKITASQGSTTQGFGRFPTITEAALVFTGDDTKDSSGKKQMDASGYAKKVQCFLILQLFRAMPGIPHISPSLRIEVSGMNTFALGGQPLGFPADATLKANQSGYIGGWGHSQAYQNLLSILLAGDTAARKAGTPPSSSDSDQLSYYPFVSQTVTLSGSDLSKMAFQGGKITVKLSTGANPAPGKLIQTFSLNFPSSASLPTPKISDASNDGARLFADRFQKIAAMSGGGGGSAAAAGSFGSQMYNAVAYFRDHRQLTINSEDVVRSMQIDPASACGGDFRLVAATPEVPVEWFKQNTKWSSSDTLQRDGHSLREERWLLLGQIGYNPRANTPADEIANFSTAQTSRPSSWATAGALVKGLKYASSAVPAVPCGMDGAMNAQARPGDWENGAGIFPDGPFIRNTMTTNFEERAGGYYVFGYNVQDDSADGINFTPNRQIASAVSFGALPTGVKAQHPWQTLLFCPDPPSRATTSLKVPAATDHPGFGSPHDNLYLDFFWMPVAEPYAISEPFSTAGKVNMNCDIYPFRYIKRRTAVCAALKSARVTAIPPDLAKDQTTGNSDNYKGLNRCKYDFRYGVNLDAVNGSLRGFEERFKTGDVFRSAAEICDLYLVPVALAGATYHPNVPALPTYATISAWWNRMTLTGDNARESPYNDIYPRLTTKSNVFQVHYRVQLLRKARSTDPAVWDETKDSIGGEQRGSVIFERYLDPGDRSMPDLASSSQFADPAYNVDRYYRHRVIERKQFAP